MDPVRIRRMLARIALVRLAYRAVVLWRERKHARRRPRAAADYLLRGKELTNFTYELANLDEGVAFVAGVLGAPRDAIAAFAAELHSDAELRASLTARLASRPDRESEPRYGKRTLLYCIVRYERPRVVVETGTYDGLGSAVLARALERNAQDGAPGELLTFDINPRAGWLLGDPMPGVERYVGDTRKTLPTALAGRRIAVFLHDSVKTRAQETFEFEEALRHRSSRAVLVTDEARATGVLAELAAREAGRYAAFREAPLRHFWAGNELGVAVFEDTKPGEWPTRKPG